MSHYNYLKTAFLTVVDMQSTIRNAKDLISVPYSQEVYFSTFDFHFGSSLDLDAKCVPFPFRNIHCTPVSDTEDTLQDIGQQAYQLMSAICALNERFGMVVPVLFLRGSVSD